MKIYFRNNNFDDIEGPDNYSVIIFMILFFIVVVGSCAYTGIIDKIEHLDIRTYETNERLRNIENKLGIIDTVKVKRSYAK